jgi:Flp pilus assembly protein TadD
MKSRLLRHITGLALPALVGLCVPAARAQTAPAASYIDTSLVAHAAQKAREKADSLAAHPAPGATAPRVDARAAAQYRDALNEMSQGQFQGAVVTLAAALARSRDNTVYRGDLAYAHARLGHLDDAHNDYVLAYQAMTQNGWYLIGLAAVRAARSDEAAAQAATLSTNHDSVAAGRADSTARAELAAAAGTVQLAVQNDSTIADGAVAVAATGWFSRAGYRSQAAEWAKIAIRYMPDFAEGWRLIMETDSIRGMEAARRYVALRPADPRGQAYLAIHMINAGEMDSAITMAEAAAADSSLRQASAEIFLVAAAQKLRQRDVDGSLALLARGQRWAIPSQQPRYNYYIGRAQLVKMTTMLNDVEERRDCDMARRADTLVADAERNLRAGASADSTRAAQLLNDVIPQFRQNVANFVSQFCRPQPPAPARPAQPAPARPRPARP